MSYVGYPHRRHHSHVGYGSGYAAPTYVTHAPSYVPRRHHSYGHQYYPSSNVAYSSHGYQPQYIAPASRSHRYYPSLFRSRHHNPNVVVASGRNIAHQASSYIQPTVTSSRYRAEGHRGQHVPVISERQYRHEFIPFSTRIRRLFGLGPKRHSGHVGRSVHVKRGSTADYISGRGYGMGHHSSSGRVYAL